MIEKDIIEMTETTGIWTMGYLSDKSIILMINFLTVIILLWLPKRIILFLENSH